MLVARDLKKEKGRPTASTKSATGSDSLCAVRPRVFGLLSADCLQTNKQTKTFFFSLSPKAVMASSMAAARIDEVVVSTGVTGMGCPCP